MLFRLGIFFLLIISSFTALAKDIKLETEKDKLSYSFGVSFGKDLSQQNIDVNSEIFYQGLKDGLEGKSKLSDKEIEDVLISFQEKQMKKQREMLQQLAKENSEKAEKFLAENKKKKGIKTSKSGLQYEVIKEGKGKSPNLDDIVTVNYRGTLLDGTEFDSSYKREKPATFKVKDVIKGWQEALQMMKPGAKYKLYIPPELAYGDKGAGNVIEPNSVLVFEVELLSIEDQKS